MSSPAFTFTVRHAPLGEWVGAVDAAGRWLVALPAVEGTAEVERLLLKGGYAPGAADEARRARAEGELGHWGDTGESPGVAPQGTPFQRRVWAELSRIPRGETRSYGELAAALACGSARAVGGAVGANPVGLFIPCHRVLAATGAIGGYAWGLPLKRRLLALERGDRISPFPAATRPAMPGGDSHE